MFETGLFGLTKQSPWLIAQPSLSLVNQCEFNLIPSSLSNPNVKNHNSNPGAGLGLAIGGGGWGGLDPPTHPTPLPWP